MVSESTRTRRRALPWIAAIVVVALAFGAFAGFRWWQDRFGGPTCQFRDGEAGGSTEEVSAEQAANAATIAQAALQRGLPEWAITVGLATAVQESKLMNLTYGDEDSLGLFQQRPSQGWGSREEILDPVYAADTFYEALEQVDGWAEMELTVASAAPSRTPTPTTRRSRR